MHISQLLMSKSSPSLVFVAICSVIAIVFISSPVNGVPIDSVSSPKHYISSSPEESVSIVLPSRNASKTENAAVLTNSRGNSKRVTRRRRLSPAKNVTSSLPTDKPKRDTSSNDNPASPAPLTNPSPNKTLTPLAKSLDTQASSVYALNSSPDPLIASVNNFFDTVRQSYQTILTITQRSLLQAIGLVDRTVGSVQDGAENSTFTLVLEGQKVAAKLYDLAPPGVNRWIQRIGTTRDNKVFQQANGVLNQFTDSKKKWYEAWFEHEHDWHNHFQDNVWPSVNNNLRVPSLPRMRFGW